MARVLRKNYDLNYSVIVTAINELINNFVASIDRVRYVTFASF